MKKKFKDNDLDQFFRQFKAIPDYYGLDQVHQLINQPTAKATPKGNSGFNHLNITIMTSTIIGLGLLLYWWAPLETNKATDTTKPIIENVPTIIESKKPNIALASDVLTRDPQLIKVEVPKNSGQPIQQPAESKKIIYPWPEDSVIDGNSLIVELTNEELEKIQSEENFRPIFKNAPSAIEKKRPDLAPANQGFAREPRQIQFLEAPRISRQISQERAENEPGINPWPEDSVIDGNSLIVEFTNEELEKIGFMLADTGIYYKNVWQGDTVYFHRALWKKGTATFGEMFRVGDKSGKRNIKLNFSHNDFYPVRTTKFMAHLIEQDEFATENDLLIPILLTQEQIKDDIEYLIWIKPSEKLYQSFPEKLKKHQEIYENIKKHKEKYPDKNLVVYQKENLINEVSKLELSTAELIKLGFMINESGISIRASGWEILIKSGMRSVRSIEDPFEYQQSLQHKIKLIFMSNTYGEQKLKWNSDNEHEDKMKQSYFEDKIQHLVPIIIKQPAYPILLSEDQIFWFEPSEALFAALPTEIGDQLRQEYALITSDSEELKTSSSCTFFEACKSTLHMRRLSIYPNPASGHTSLEFELDQAIKGRVVLVDIAGTIVKELLPEREFKFGRNSFTFDLSNVKEGIYLLTIDSDHGFKTYRLMVSR